MRQSALLDAHVADVGCIQGHWNPDAAAAGVVSAAHHAEVWCPLGGNVTCRAVAKRPGLSGCPALLQTALTGGKSPAMQ